MQTNKGAFARWLAIALVVAILAPPAVGCYGKFPLTKAVYRFNGEVSSDRLLRSVLMWGFIILPVYEIAMIGDAIIFNLIQFWTGETLQIGSASEKDGVRASLSPSADGREALLSLSKDGLTNQQVRFMRLPNGTVEVRSLQGELSGIVRPNTEGGLDLLDAHGNLIQVLPAQALLGM